MSTTNIIVGVAICAVFGGLTIAIRHRIRDVFAALLVVGIAALAIAVSIDQVQQYRDQKAAQSTIAQSETPAVSGSSAAPPAQPPVVLPIRPTMMQGPSAAAAPPAVPNPFAGNR